MGGPEERLGRRFFRRDAAMVARGLLGCRLVRIIGGRRVSGRIVETEAYLGVADRACHSYGGRRTARTETMYGDGGTAYVFLNYGIHHMLNVVTAEVGDPSAVLIRALEPEEGIGAMSARRPAARKLIDLCSGPGKLGAALAIDLEHDGLDLVTSRELFIEPMLRSGSFRISRSPRIGVAYAGAWARRLLRFTIAGNPCVSR